jgi:phosphate-selective porin OprO and OprP
MSMDVPDGSTVCADQPRGGIKLLAAVCLGAWLMAGSAGAQVPQWPPLPQAVIPASGIPMGHTSDATPIEATEATAGPLHHPGIAPHVLSEAKPVEQSASMRIRGRIHLDWWTFPEASDGIAAFEGVAPQDRIIARRARIEIGGTLPDFMVYKMDVDFATPSSPEFRDLYIGWEELPYLQRVLLGNQKRPRGFDSLTSSNQILFMERSLVSQAFNEGERRFGVQSYGTSESEVYHWRFGAFLMQDIASTGAYIGNDYQMELVGRLSSSPFYDEDSGGRSYVHWGISGTAGFPAGQNGPAGTFTNQARFRTRTEIRSTNRWLDTTAIADAENLEMLGIEGVVNLGPFQVGSEWQGAWVHRNGADDLFFNGAYVYVAYFLTGEHQPYRRDGGVLDRPKPFQNFWRVRTCDGGTATGWGAWQILARYSYLDLSDDNVLGGRGNNFTGGLNWYWNANARMMFNYVYGNVDEHASVGGFTEGYSHTFGTRFQVDF